MNLWDWVILAVVAAAIVFAALCLRSKRRKGSCCTGCAMGCKSCTGEKDACERRRSAEEGR